MLLNLLPIKLTDTDVYFKELSFYEYKNVCKMLLSEDNKQLNDCFNNIISSCVQTDRVLNIIDKFKCIIAIRNTVLGNEITYIKDNKRINANISSLPEQQFNDDPIYYDTLTFKSPCNFYTTGYDNFVAECLVKIKDISVEDFSISQKVEILNEMCLPLATICKTIYNTFAERNIEIFKNFIINIYDTTAILNFLKNIFQEDLGNLLKFEFVCIQNLNLHSLDFQTYTYPELKIFLNHLNKEKTSQNNE